MNTFAVFSRPKILLSLSGFLLATTSALQTMGANALVVKAPPQSPQEQQRMFHLPQGFRIQLIASEPAIVKPINMKFDSAGRLYVTGSVEYPFASAAGSKGRDTICRIVDRDGDGVPETVSVFADGLNIPIGITPLPAGVFAYSIPYLIRFVDKEGGGRADRREIAYREFEFRDTHGMVNALTYWIDGWVYACHGYGNNSAVTAADGSSITLRFGNTFRVRPDGSRVETFSFGQVNPFGLAFDPRGDAYAADCESRPATLLLRDAYYRSFGKPHDGLGFGPDMMRHDHGSSGIAGIVFYAADHFPERFRSTIFLGNPITGRINHDRIETRGSTHTAIELPDFLTCDDPWFRPVDLQLAPDGSLYVADFYNCIIGHTEVPLNHPLRDKKRGRIWRISYVGDGKSQGLRLKPADLSVAGPDVLLAALSDPNLTVRTLATHELVDRIGAPAAVPARELVESTAVPEARAHGLWVLYRLGSLDPGLAKRLAEDKAPLVRLHAIKALAEEREWQAWQRTLCFRALADSDAFVRRAAADAMARHPDLANIDPLVDCWRTADPADAMLIHVIRIALRNSMRGHNEDLASLIPRYQSSTDTQWRLMDACLGLHTRQAAALVLAFQQANPGVSQRPAETLRFIANTIDFQRMREVYQLALAYRGRERELERSALTAMFRAGRERSAPVPEELNVWAQSVTDAFLHDSDEKRVQRGIELASETRLPSAVKSLSAIVGGTRFANLRGLAANALVGIDPAAALPVVESVVRNSAAPLSVRCDVVESLRSVSSPGSRALLLSLFKIAPAPLAASIAQTLARSKEGANDLIEAAEKGLCSPQLLDDSGIRIRLRYAELTELESRLHKLLQGIPRSEQRIRNSIATISRQFRKCEPSPQHGALVFEKTCSGCHQIGGRGRRVGPTLDGVGNRGIDRLIEDVLDPNRNVDASFRATVLTLNDGRIANGIVMREEGPIVVFVDEKGSEQRIPISSIEHRTISRLSPMPSNIAAALSQQEICDLLAYLLQQRAPGESNR